MCDGERQWVATIWGLCMGQLGLIMYCLGGDPWAPRAGDMSDRDSDVLGFVYLS